MNGLNAIVAFANRGLK